MSKALRMGKVSARGGFNLFWGLAISTVISAVGVIVVARLLSPSEYGIVAVALTAPSLIQIFRDWGIDTATIRYTAHYNLEDKSANVRSTMIACLAFEILLGLSLAMISFLLSSFIATDVFKRPEIGPLIQIASLGIFGGALSIAAQSAFIGLERMSFNSVLMILSSCLTTVSMTVLIVLGLGTYGAILGNTIAALIAGLTGTLLMLRMWRSLRKPRENGGLKIVENIKTMLKYGLPLSLSAIITGLLAQFYRFLMAIYVTDLMIGNYSVATNFSVLITFFSTPISTVLFPAFSKLDSKKERQVTKDVFRFSVKYGAFLVVPVATAVIALSQPAVSTLFGREYSYAPLFLALVTVTYLFSAFGGLSIGNLINSQGKTRISLLLTMLTSSIGFPLGLVLIPRFGIIGLIVTSLVDGIPSLILGLRWIRTNFGATIDWVSSIKILLSAAAAAAVTYLILSQISLSSWITLVAGGTIFLSTFIITTTLVKTIDESDRNNLTEMSKDLGLLHQVVNFLLNIIKKLTAAFWH